MQGAPIGFDEALIYLGALAVAWYLMLNAWRENHRNFFVALWQATGPSLNLTGRVGVLVGLGLAFREAWLQFIDDKALASGCVVLSAGLGLIAVGVYRGRRRQFAQDGTD